jgi:hypothetical protein
MVAQIFFYRSSPNELLFTPCSVYLALQIFANSHAKTVGKRLFFLVITTPPAELAEIFFRWGLALILQEGYYGPSR